jgi:hypothetical protein
MGSPTEFLTLSILEFHSGAVVCSLSDVLETGDVPQRFFLSAQPAGASCAEPKNEEREQLRQALTAAVLAENQKEQP